MKRAGRNSGHTVTSVIRMNDVRPCPKCFMKMAFRDLILHVRDCTGVGRTWFEGLAENTGNVVAMAAKLKNAELRMRNGE